MRNPFEFLRQAVTPTYLGVDIGTTSIKVVEVEQGLNRPKISNYTILESQSSLIRANTVFQTSSLKLFDQEITELLRLILREMKPKTSEAIASLPPFSAFITTLILPEMGASDLKRAMTFQARQYIPLPTSEVAIDWIKIGEQKDEKGFVSQQILLIAVPQEQIRKYQKIFKGAGLSLVALEIESFGLARSLIGHDPTPTIIVDIGSRSTAIAIVDGGQLRSVGQTDFSGASLTQALASSLNINPVRAEELKRERGIIAIGPNFELSTIMMPFLDVIINEVKRAEFTYESQFPAAAKIERVILAGGGANLLGIEKYFGEQFGIPAVKASPFSKFEYPSAIEPFVNELNPLMTVSLGLALREFSS